MGGPLADWFSLQGGKSEPAYVEAINIDRRDDFFLTVGGAPAWAERQRNWSASLPMVRSGI